MSKPVIITAAITGASHIPTMSQYLPLTPQEIVDNAVGAAQAGAAVVHLHSRDVVTGKPTNDPVVMAEMVSEIRAKCDVLVCCTTGAAIGMSIAERGQTIPAAKPELGSCNAGSVNFCFAPVADKFKEFRFDWEYAHAKNTYKQTFANTFQDIETFIELMAENGTKPEFEVYDAGMISNIAYFMNKGMLKKPVYLQFVLGIMGGMPATLNNLNFLVQQAYEVLGEGNFVWSCAAAGKMEFDITTAGLLLGGNVRVGLEDNLYLGKGILAKTNAELVERMATITTALGREIATPAQAREILGL